VGDDARARFQLPREHGPQLFVGRGQQEERHDGSGGDVSRHDVLNAEFDSPFDAGRPGVGPGSFNQSGIDIEPDRSRAVLHGRGDGNPAVPASQVVNDILLRHLCKRQHPLHHIVRCGNEWRKSLLMSSKVRAQEVQREQQ
jgi:hypothetical protein